MVIQPSSPLLNLFAIPVAMAVIGLTHPVVADIDFEWAVVDHPGNAVDQDYNGNGQFGAVSYLYRISKHEVTNAQYATFLNQVAASDPHGLFSNSMDITRNGSDGSYTYVATAGSENKPVRFVSFFDAMRFVNWLENGQGNGDTETGVYTIGSGTNETRSQGAKFFIPSEHEWYKAAYYDPNVGDGYWLYPYMTDLPPTAELPPGGSNSTNMSHAVGGTSEVGSYVSSTGFFGTLDQAGNVFEWTEGINGSLRVQRGGSWPDDLIGSAASFRGGGPPDTEQPTVGFRVASAIEVAFDWAVVDNAGNAADQDYNGNGQFGAVDYRYRISKHEVTNAQFATFLNQVAASDPHSLFSNSMDITRNGSDGSYTYFANPGFENKPVRFVSFFDAMRFTNWLENGQGNGDTEAGVYTIGSGTDETRSSSARLFIPSEDEWYKAAYHDPNVGDEYWLYPYQSDTPPDAEPPPGGLNSTNMLNVVGGTTDIGAYPASVSYYDTFDQAGNVFEWTEGVNGVLRVQRGGSWPDNLIGCAASFRGGGPPTTEQPTVGFRVATLFELGDVNQDGAINLLDVDSFIASLAGGTYQFEADCNQDGVVNLLDVGCFIAVLAGS